MEGRPFFLTSSVVQQLAWEFRQTYDADVCEMKEKARDCESSIVGIQSQWKSRHHSASGQTGEMQKAILHYIMRVWMLQVLNSFYLNCAKDYRRVRRELMGCIIGQEHSRAVVKKIWQLWRTRMLLTHWNYWVEYQDRQGASRALAWTVKGKR